MTHKIVVRNDSKKASLKFVLDPCFANPRMSKMTYSYKFLNRQFDGLDVLEM